MDTNNATEDPVKDVSPEAEAVAEEKKPASEKKEEVPEETVEVKPAETAGDDTAASPAANKAESEELPPEEASEEQIDESLDVQANLKTDEPSTKKDNADSVPEAQTEVTALDESDEKFEDAVDSEEKLEPGVSVLFYLLYTVDYPDSFNCWIKLNLDWAIVNIA